MKITNYRWFIGDLKFLSKIDWFNSLLLFSKFNDSFKFLYKIDNNIPIENSKPATPNIKKDMLNKVISQYTAPSKTPKVYNTIQINSDKNRIDIKFFGFKAIRIIRNQKTRDQKDNHVNILKFKYYNSTTSFFKVITWFSNIL